MTPRAWIALGWVVALALAGGVRAWNALTGALLWGYDAWGHVAYVLFLDLYRGVPWADQGWSYFHPPFHYALGWALAQLRSGEVLARGLPLLASAASLATAGLAALQAGWATPKPRGLRLLAFAAVAFLPVHFVLSTMLGNEMTLTVLAAGAVALFIANQRRRRPSLLLDAATGLVLGLALLTKFNGILALLTVGAAVLVGGRAPDAVRDSFGRRAVRATLLAAVAAAVCGPYYARNVREFGNPFELSRGYPLVAQVEAEQRPGVRTWRDYTTFPIRAFRDPNPRAPHMLHSVFATVYANVWVDVYRESDVERALEANREKWPWSAWLLAAGLIPTALFLAGAALALRDVARGRRREVYVPLLIQTGGTLCAFVLFSWRVPIWSALKASYLLPLSVPYGVFCARSVLALWHRTIAWQRWAAPATFAAMSLASAVLATDGMVLPRRADAPATGALHFYFGEYDQARRIYGRLITGARDPRPWVDNLAAVELADGNADFARTLYARADALAPGDGYRRGRLAVATASTGDLATALSLLDAALADDSLPELRANRGAIRAAAGDADGAVTDLRAALEIQPDMTPAWRNLARVLASEGLTAEAHEASDLAAAAACRSPRGYPYGVGTGEVIEWGVGRRWLLLLDGDALRPALPEWFRTACAEGGAA